MENSGNNYADFIDKRREDDEKAHTDFYCPRCRKAVKEDIWHWGYEMCMPCFNEGEK